MTTNQYNGAKSLLTPDNHALVLIDHQYPQLLSVTSHQPSDRLSQCDRTGEGGQGIQRANPADDGRCETPAPLERTPGGLPRSGAHRPHGPELVGRSARRRLGQADGAQEARDSRPVDGDLPELGRSDPHSATAITCTLSRMPPAELPRRATQWLSSVWCRRAPSPSARWRIRSNSSGTGRAKKLSRESSDFRRARAWLQQSHYLAAGYARPEGRDPVGFLSNSLSEPCIQRRLRAPFARRARPTLRGPWVALVVGFGLGTHRIRIRRVSSISPAPCGRSPTVTASPGRNSHLFNTHRYQLTTANCGVAQGL